MGIIVSTWIFYLDGKNHEQCCSNSGVSTFCRAFCQGSVPDVADTSDLIDCAVQSEKILTCVEAGRCKWKLI